VNDRGAVMRGFGRVIGGRLGRSAEDAADQMTREQQAEIDRTSTQPYQETAQARSQGARVTDLKVEFYSFLWTDRHENGGWVVLPPPERKNRCGLSTDRAGLCLNIINANPGQSFSVRFYQADRLVSEFSFQTNEIGEFFSMFPVTFAASGHYKVAVATTGTNVKEIGIDVTA